MSFGRYQFLSWARRGIARHVAEKDTLGKTNGVAEERARIPLRVKLNTGDIEQHHLALTGPGDITGISTKTIIRTEPLNGIADYEPNLLPYIEFYDEDFPYRYTPASPAVAGRHQRPWLALVVLKENEFLDTNRREPLASIRVASESFLPPSDELHLWCHMHSNLPHDESQFEAFLDGLEEDLKTDPDGVYSRLICPRKLEAKTLYHAFLIPAYETGRRAGLGQPISGIKAQTPSWPGQNNEFPVYHRWNFRTGKNFDFEYLVKQLKPRIMDDRVGVREMDCSRPAFVRADVASEVRPPNPEILKLGGALMAPDAQVSKFPAASVAQPFLEDVEKLVNLNRLQEENPDEDPFVTIPYYGMNHALRRDPSRPGKRITPAFDPSSDRWYNQINRDPIYRVPAGFGKRVVQENQEHFADQAWKQLSDVLEANRKMRIARLAAEALGKVYAKTLATKAKESFLAFAKPIGPRVIFDSKTVKIRIDESMVANASIDSAFSRMTRRNTAIIKGINSRGNTSTFNFDMMIRKTNRTNGISAVVAENFKISPRLNNLTSFTSPSTASAVKVWSSQSNLDADFVFNQPSFSGGLPAITLWKNVFSPSLFGATGPAAGIPSGPTIPGISLPGVSAPTVSPIASVGPSIGTTAPSTATTGFGTTAILRVIPLVNTTMANNRLTAAKHNAQVRTAYKEVTQRFQFEDTVDASPALDTMALRRAFDKAIRPSLSYAHVTDKLIRWPTGTVKPPKENFLAAMAYPDLPEPTYQYLVNVDKEFLLPNLDLIQNNTLSLLKTNQRFIESYLVGLNYEMGRELMWREYPTDMRGSYFRQFWDVSGFVTPDTTPEDAESFKDIKPIHRWPSASKLGQNNARDENNDTEKLVFVIRGDLLKKFPNTVIFAQKALKDEESNDTTDTVIRTGELTESQYRKEILFPLYQAEISPDIKLLGFNLTIEQASGSEKTPGFTDKRGWYFVLAEVPGEPRFGMDIDFQPNDTTNLTWNDLSWENLPEKTRFIRGGTSPLGVPATVPGRWGKSSADMAAILLQRPVMVAIHATEMLDVSVPAELDFIETLSLTEYINGLGQTFR